MQDLEEMKEIASHIIYNGGLTSKRITLEQVLELITRCENAEKELIDIKDECAELHAKVIKINNENEAPKGFGSWKDAAINERLKRVAIEAELKELREQTAVGFVRMDCFTDNKIYQENELEKGWDVLPVYLGNPPVAQSRDSAEPAIWMRELGGILDESTTTYKIPKGQEESYKDFVPLFKQSNANAHSEPAPEKNLFWRENLANKYCEQHCIAPNTKEHAIAVTAFVVGIGMNQQSPAVAAPTEQQILRVAEMVMPAAFMAEENYKICSFAYALLSAPQASAEQPSNMVLIRKDVVNFLNGTGELLNCNFGEEARKHGGQFWWRKFLPIIAQDEVKE